MTRRARVLARIGARWWPLGGLWAGQLDGLDLGPAANDGAPAAA